ncbi:hypothetical protein SGPA1_40236 [Streptomyces misionensis JCM 4497]
MGVLQPRPQGVLQPHHHRTVHRRRLLRRHHRTGRRPARQARPERRGVRLDRGPRPRPRRLRHRRPLRGRLGPGHRVLARGQGRGALERPHRRRWLTPRAPDPRPRGPSHAGRQDGRPAVLLSHLASGHSAGRRTAGWIDGGPVRADDDADGPGAPGRAHHATPLSHHHEPEPYEGYWTRLSTCCHECVYASRPEKPHVSAIR